MKERLRNLNPVMSEAISEPLACCVFVREIRNVEIVFKNGIGYDSSKLFGSVKRKVGHALYRRASRINSRIGVFLGSEFEVLTSLLLWN